MDKNKIKVMVAVIMALSIVSISVAFAALSTSLVISGTATVNSGSWNISFQNLDVKTPTGSASFITEPSIASPTSINSYYAILKNDGDSVSFEFDVVNSGSIDAKLTSLVKNAIPTCTGTDAITGDADAALVCADLSYTFSYSDGSTISLNDVIAASTSKRLKVTLSYNTSTLPDNQVDISGLGITMLFGQN